MRVGVIVMIEGTDHSIMDWTLDIDDIIQQPQTKWKELALKINRRAKRGKHRRVDIFLYLRDGLLEGVRNHEILKDLVATARNHVWAGNVYVVWDKTRDAAVETGFAPLDERNLLVNFYRALLEERVTNLIEIRSTKSASAKSAFQKLRGVLRGRVATLAGLRTDLKALVHGNGWSPVLRSESRDLARLLNVFVKEGRLTSSAPNELLVFEASAGRSVKALMARSKGARRVVAATVETDSDDLRRDCAAVQPPPDVLVFHSVFQIIYALLQLYDAEKSKRDHESYYADVLAEFRDADADVPVEIEPVEVVKEARFPPPMAASPLNVLITSAFDDRTEPGHSIAAASEIGAILRNVTSLQDVEVHPYMSCQSFPKLLESKQYTAWIHLSHGKGGDLYDPKTGLYVPPGIWLNCFRAYKGGLSLAIFSSCNSANAARLFASFGVGVAIGFRHEVLDVAPEILTQKVVPAAMHSGGDQEAILVAFRDACRSLAARVTDEGENYAEARPVAFRSLRK